ncbi:MAG: c-type cytochrome domain-containing protein [Chloroflexota bacterium]
MIPESDEYPITAAPASGLVPQIPFQSPRVMGGAQEYVYRELLVDEVFACLQSGQTLYGFTRLNSNVRANPSSDGCYMGRIPAGRLVRVDDVFAENRPVSLLDGGGYLDLLLSSVSVQPAIASVDTVQDTDHTSIGYVEDIQPIFMRTCNTCHSGVAQSKGLQVTEYEPLLRGSTTGAVVVPGDPDASSLWTQIDTNVMPMIGQLPDDEKALIRAWIASGAPETRPAQEPSTTNQSRQSRPKVPIQDLPFWMSVFPEDADLIANQCATSLVNPRSLVSSSLFLPIGCNRPPTEDEENQLLVEFGLRAAPQEQVVSLLPTPTPRLAEPVVANVAAATAAPVAVLAAPQAPAPTATPAPPAPPAITTAIQAAPLGLGPPSDDDPWLIPRGGFCMAQRLHKNDRGINALAFAPDGRLFMALDAKLTGEQDRYVLYDAYHPSRSVVVFDSWTDGGLQEIMRESSRITGLAYHNGAVYVSRAGEVGYIPDNGVYAPLAGGFAVQSQLFHANNGIAVVDGWVYVSTGGIRDGYSDGLIENHSETDALNIVTGGNPFASRVVRAPISQLLSERSINAFQTAARGFRNPYGLAADPFGRLWVTDNGATDMPEHMIAGDELNLFEPRTLPPSAQGNELETPFYGFPLALNGSPPDWYAKPYLDLGNTAAPTGVTWAYNTVFYAHYGRNPGLYRLAHAGNGTIVGERILLAWPLVALATAPDGALWIGMGDGSLYRMTQGC